MTLLHEDASHRFDDPILLRLITQIHESQIELDRKLTKHMVGEPKEIADSIAGALTKMMADAFPDGDSDGHRRRHESELKRLESRAKFWGTMATEISKWGLIGFLGWAVYALWQAFLLGPRK